jgi:hypothetical protein
VKKTKRWFKCKVLPFGLTLSPQHFTKLVKVIFNKWRKEGVICSTYIDDWIFAARSKQEALLLRDKIEKEMAELGWVRHLTKGQWEPATTVEFLGIGINTADGTWFIPDDKKKQLVDLLKSVLEKEQVQARVLARVAGKVLSLSRAIPLGKLYVRESFEDLWSAGVYETNCWSQMTSLSSETKADLQRVLDCIQGIERSPLWFPRRLWVVEADASLTAWGGRLLKPHKPAAGEFPPELNHLLIHSKEALAIFYVLQACAVELRGRSVLLRTDNMFLFSYLVNMGGNGRGEQRVMLGLVKEIFAWALQNNTKLITAEWIPSEANFIPDVLSRRVDHGNWRVAAWVFAIAERNWGPHSVDRMASISNHKCARFNSWIACPGCEAVNCFTQDWAGENNWVAPPLGAIAQVLEFILEEGVNATLLVPTWNQTWRPLLEAMRVDGVAIRGPPSTFLSPESNGGQEVFKNHLWRFELVRVSGARGQLRFGSRS